MPNPDDPIKYAALVAAHPAAAADVLAAVDDVATAVQRGLVSGAVWLAARTLAAVAPATPCTAGDR